MHQALVPQGFDIAAAWGSLLPSNTNIYRESPQKSPQFCGSAVVGSKPGQGWSLRPRRGLHPCLLRDWFDSEPYDPDPAQIGGGSTIHVSINDSIAIDLTPSLITRTRQKSAGPRAHARVTTILL